MPSTTMRVPMSANRAQRLPEYNGPGQAPMVAQTSARLDDSAGAIVTANWRNGTANPWKDIERTFGNVAKIADNVYTFHDRYSKYKAQEALNNYQEAMMIKKADLERLEGSNAIGANGGKSVQQQLQAYAEELRGKLGENLNERSRMFFDNFAGSEDKKNYVWAVNKERREWDAYQKTVDLGTIQTAVNTAMNDPSQAGNSMGILKATYEQMARREGWSPEFTKAKVTQEEQKLLSDMIGTVLDGGDIAGAGQLMSVYGSKLSPALRMKYANARGGMVLEQAKSMMDAGDFAGARRLIAQNAMFGGSTGGNAFAGMGGNGIGSLAAGFESGRAGSAAVGYDSTGGTSYGRYQLSSKQGSLTGFLNLLSASGEEGKAIADRLKASGPANTGSSNGAFAEQWKKEVAAHPQLMEDMQHKYIEQTHYQPALNALPKGLRDMVTNSGPLQEMLWSTSVQHGAGGAAKLMKRVWQDGMTPQELASAVYDARGNQFGSSSAEVQAAVRNRFQREKAMVLSALNGETPRQMPNPDGTVSEEAPAQGKRPVYSLGNPALDARVNHFMKTLDKEERKAKITVIGQEIWQNTNGFHDKERTAQAKNMLMSMNMDDADKAEVLTIIEKMDKLETEKWKARDYTDALKFCEDAQAKGMNILDFNKALETAQISPEAKEMARKQYGANAASSVTYENINAQHKLFAMIDEKPDMKDEEIAAFASTNKLTPDQYNAALKYKAEGGNVGHLKQSYINDAFREMYVGKSNNDVPEWMYGAVAKMLKPGDPVTVESIKPLIARALIKGKAENPGIFNSNSMKYGEALTNPNVKPGTFTPNDLTAKQKLAIIDRIKKDTGKTVTDDRAIIEEYLARPNLYPSEG